MKKPLCTKRLALCASGLVLLSCLIHIFLILNPDISAARYMNLDELPEISPLSNALLILGELSILPFLGVCLWNAFTTSISYTKSLVFAILSGLFWIGSTYGTMLFNNLAMSAGRKAEMIAVISSIGISRSFIPDLNAIAFALVCSALAIEMYISKKDKNASVQS